MATSITLILCVGCGGSGVSSIAPADDVEPSSAQSDAQENEQPQVDDPSASHALGSIVLGESHSGGESVSTPIVSATFVPSVRKSTSCSKKLDGCTLTTLPHCAKTCGEDEVCAWTEGCAASCQKGGPETDTFDAGSLAFSGTKTSITLSPPYVYEAKDEGAPFSSGAEVRVKAEGATSAGFAAFDEAFTATTIIRANPALQKLSRDEVFGTGPLSVGWVPGEDTIVVTVSSAYGSASCNVKDALGRFDVPRSVIDAVRTAPDGKSKDSSLTTSVARERKEVKKDRKTKGTLSGAKVAPTGWLELVTSSSEVATFEACPAGGDCEPAGVCISAPEDTLELCSDGCSNDGDPYVDCDDYDCCGVRTNCPANTACGRK